MNAEELAKIKRFASAIRIETLKELKALGFGHIGGSFSIVEVLAVLYGSVMKYDTKRPDWQDRDFLIVSKGHAGPAVYACLALLGYFPKEWLQTLNKAHTRLPSHCDRNLTPGIDATTGSLGQGISQAVGIALGIHLKEKDNVIYCILGDGELNEGQVWEALAFASAKSLHNLCVFVDVNGKQLDGYCKDVLDMEPIAEKLKAFGFYTMRIDGHDILQVVEAIENRSETQPTAIVLDTIKGKGIAEVEHSFWNHSITASDEKWEAYISVLEGETQHD